MKREEEEKEENEGDYKTGELNQIEKCLSTKKERIIRKRKKHVGEFQ